MIKARITAEDITIELSDEAMARVDADRARIRAELEERAAALFREAMEKAASGGRRIRYDEPPPEALTDAFRSAWAATMEGREVVHELTDDEKDEIAEAVKRITEKFGPMVYGRPPADVPIGIALETGGSGDIVRMRMLTNEEQDAFVPLSPGYRWEPVNDARPHHSVCIDVPSGESRQFRAHMVGKSITGAEVVIEALNAAYDSAREMAKRRDEARASWLALEPRRVKILRMALAWEAVRRHPGRSQLANTGARKKRGGGHRSHLSTRRRR